jgi:hypothetical protein
MPQDRLVEWLKFKQKQDNIRAEFEQRVSEARRKVLEQHATEEQAFWTGQPRVAWQLNANGYSATPHSLVNASSSSGSQRVGQRVVDNPTVSGPWGPSQMLTLGELKAPAIAPKRRPAQNHGPLALGQPDVPANAPKRGGAKAVPPAATQGADAARSQVCNSLSACRYSA